jgi:uncharacterized membrane protein HdeD (DUF308 family)
MARPSYGWGLLSTILGGVLASVVMIVPAWLWSRYVLDVAFDSIVGRGEGLSNGDRIFLYAGDLAIAFVAFLVYAWCVKRLYALREVKLPLWDTFAALVATAILAAIVAFFLPFVGLLIVIFVAPLFVNGVASGGPVVRAAAPREVDVYTGNPSTAPR